MIVRSKHLIIIFALIVLTAYAASDKTSQGPLEILPDDFSSKVFNHITYLAAMGHRQVGSENDSRSVQYIKEQLENFNIDVEVQEFDVKSFEYDRLNFEVGKKQYDVIGLGFNPYANKKEFYGSAILIDLNDPEVRMAREEIEGKTIITNNWNGHFRLLPYKPELIIYVDAMTFEKIKSKGQLNYILDIKGSLVTYHSANIIGRVGNNKSTAQEILITAHYDTYKQQTPGASDNASGIGILIELARYFKKIEKELDCAVKFIAFGGEEIGMAGSRNYLDNNKKTLQQCELLFNIDDVGGNGNLLLEMSGGIVGIPAVKGMSQIPQNLKDYSWEGISSTWRIVIDDDLMRILMASNHPQWLSEIANKAVVELGYKLTPTSTMGSDQLSFAQAGIVTSGIGIPNENNHTPQDSVEKIEKKQLKIVGEIVSRIILGAIKRLGEK